MKLVTRLAAAGLGVAATFGIVGVNASLAGASPGPSTFTCSGTASSPEVVTQGTYVSITMPPGSLCFIEGPVADLSPLRLGTSSALAVLAGSLTVSAPVTVGPGAVMATPSNSTPVDIHGPVSVQSNAVFLLGTETPGGPDFASIFGPVRGVDASSVQIHNTQVAGPVTLTGGGGENALFDELAEEMGASGPFNFNDLEDNQIGGPVSETGYFGAWAGILRDVINGPMTFSDNSEAPNIDEYDIGSDLINGPATCSNNDPAPNLGESPGYLSTVRGPTRGNQALTCTGVTDGVSGPTVS